MKWLNFFWIFLILLISLMVVRFVFGGDEDEWFCQNNTWIKHGDPLVSKPSYDCID